MGHQRIAREFTHGLYLNAMVFLIAYDLKTPNDTEENYKLIREGIKSACKSWCRIEQSVWLVESSKHAGSIRDILRGYLHEKDLLFVARLKGNWASRNLGLERASWLKKRIF